MHFASADAQVAIYRCVTAPLFGAEFNPIDGNPEPASVLGAQYVERSKRPCHFQGNLWLVFFMT